MEIFNNKIDKSEKSNVIDECKVDSTVIGIRGKEI